MELVKINALHTEPPQGCLAFFANRLRLEGSSRLRRRVAFIPDQATLGKNHGPLGCRQLSQQAANNFLGMTQAVYGGGIDPVDTMLQCMANGQDGLVIILRSPSVSPTTSAERPGSKTGLCDWDSTQAQR